MRASGFTFIELLIVITIISILSLLAYPNYQKYILKARRVDGQTALLQLANQMEQFYLEHQTYMGKNLENTASTSSGWYNLKILAATDTFYKLEAKAIKAQRHDLLCPVLTLDSLGTKGQNIKCWSW